MIRELLGVTPETFVNTELLYTERVGGILAEVGFGCLIAEGSRNLIKEYDPVNVFQNHLPTLLRHINLSEDLELRFSEKDCEGYHLIPKKFADWIKSMEGDVLTLYFNYTNLCVHHRNENTDSRFYPEFPQRSQNQRH